MSEKSVLKSNKVYEAVGPYSHAVVYNGMVYTSGIIAIDSKTNQVLPAEISVQTTAVLNYLKTILQECSSSLENVLKITVYLKDMNHFGAVNQIYQSFFSNLSGYPARSCVEVSRLPKDVLIEIECVAFVSQK